VNAFTESLALELRAFNIRVGLILPGRAPQTRFGENASVTQATDVAQAVWRMVHDPDAPSRLPAGEDALAMAQASHRLV